MSRMAISRRKFDVQQLVGWQENLLLDPAYQREGGIWTKSRQQLFIDSILNGFDVPALYLHQLRPPEFHQGRAASYAVIDGRQRLEALEEFASGRLALADDFRLLEDVEDSQPVLTEEFAGGKERFGGLTLNDLRELAPALAYRFLDYEIPVTVVDTDDAELIEELFFRLNEGVPLNPAEKRTRGELLRSQIIPLVSDDDLFRCAGFRNLRRKYEDLFLRLLFVKSRDGSVHDVPDMKRTLIDDFASSFRPAFGESFTESQRADMQQELTDLVDGVRPTLEAMNRIFNEGDVLLRQQSTFFIYYLVIEQLLRDGASLPSRDDFARFGEELSSLRGRDEEKLTPDQRDALEYAAPLRETTTGSYSQLKAEILLRYLSGRLKIA
ncbi:GmrSD restriction endonuclease domain-containing protein [Nocardioides dilutus]